MVPVGIPVSSDEAAPRDHLRGVSQDSRGRIKGPEEAARELTGRRRRPADLPKTLAAPAGPARAELENGVSVGSSGREVKKPWELGPSQNQPLFGASGLFPSAAARGGAWWVVQKWRPHRGQTQNCSGFHGPPGVGSRISIWVPHR